MSNIFDLHIHPSIKPMLKKKGSRFSPWDVKKNDIDDIQDNVFDSQSALTQLHAVSRLACFSLHAIEGEFLRPNLLKFAGSLVKEIDEAVMHDVINGRMIYHQTLQEELDHLLAHLTDPSGTKKVKIINSISEYDSTSPDTHLIMSIEGAHCFLDQNNLKTVAGIAAEAKDGITRFRTWRDKHRLLYLTVTHMTDNPYCNHAYPLPHFKHGVLPFAREPFVPNGHGLTAAGKELLHAALTEKPDRRVFIDIKHMSLITRLEYYQWRRETMAATGDSWPILATHMGVTGMSYRSIEAQTDRAKDRNLGVIVGYDSRHGYEHLDGKNHTRFNPTSINLYDEDIFEIMSSGGLIGVSLDQRVLGMFGEKNAKDFGEIFNESEFDSFGNLWTPPNFKLLPDNAAHAGASDINTNINKQEKNDTKALAYLANNILHYIEVGLHNGIAEPWKFLCFGSDFDGLINALDTCPNIEKVADVVQKLPAIIDAMAKQSPFKNEIAAVGGATIVKLLSFDNAKAFLDKHFK